MIFFTVGLLLALAGQGFAQGAFGSGSGPNAIVTPPPFSGDIFTGSSFEGAPPPPSLTHMDPNAFAAANIVSSIPESSTTALIIVGGLCVIFSRYFCRRIFVKPSED